MRSTVLLFLSVLTLCSCSVSRQISRTAEKGILKNETLRPAHVGISLYEPASGKYWYNYQGDHYFVPASNTKIATCYAAMKYLGDSLVGLKYLDTDTALFIQPTGDPTLLHRDFAYQPVARFIKESHKPIYYVQPYWQAYAYGTGWAWDDYNDYYMPERSELPIYGNVLRIQLQQTNNHLQLKGDIPFYRYRINELVDPLVKNIQVKRRRLENTFDVISGDAAFTGADIPFQTFENHRLLEDTLQVFWKDRVRFPANMPFQKIYSQPTDSVLKAMMHQSDNFFAEQSLLMVSNEVLGVMSDTKIIDTLLKGVYKDLPQKPRWVDGSGLSRYNLFTPQDLVAILAKLQNDFGMERVKSIFPTGGEGTLKNYYKRDSGYLFAKTGSMTGVLALSGYLYTRKNKLLLFSVLVNNNASSAAVRQAIEAFLESVREKY